MARKFSFIALHFYSSSHQCRIQSWTLGGHNCLFHLKSFLTLLFAIGNIAVGGHGPRPPGSAPVGHAPCSSHQSTRW